MPVVCLLAEISHTEAVARVRHTFICTFSHFVTLVFNVSALLVIH